MAMFDVLITGGTVVDGTGSPGFRADVGITGEKIAAIGNLSAESARRVIDATGLTVSPGFIDSHAHSDGVLLWDPQHANGLRQGVTTEILGQDGLSYAPLSAENYRMNRRYLAGILGEPPEDLDMSSVAAFRSHYHKKVSINTAYCIAHGAIRIETVGFRDAPLTGDALEKAKRLIREGMEQGAVGLATGMSYMPNAYSDTAELIELCKVVAEYGGVYVTHLRDMNPERGFGGGGVPEALEIGRRSGVKVHFSHYRTAANNAGRVAERMEMIDKAKAEGVDCTLELYPYPTGSTFPASFFGGDIHDGGPDAMMARLRDPAMRKQLIQYLDDASHRSLNDAVLTHLGKNKHLEGMALPDIARDRGVSMGTALLDLLIEEDLQVGYRGAPPDSVAIWQQVSRDCMEFLSRPDYMVGSDSIPIGSYPHPRAYGCFPRFLGRLRRAYPLISLEQTVQRMTENPARRFGLQGRGVLKKGNFADIVVFDPERIIDNATYDDPVQFPTGIPHVVVNGQVAVDHERCTGVLAGQAVP
jgi:N-acyl-D-amino-acid deacylase